jgi:hypothetical protein
MPKGSKGVRLSIVAIEPIGKTAYTVVRMRVPRRLQFAPQTADEAFELWWEYADLTGTTISSDISRKLAVSDGHASKVMKEFIKRRANVLVIPPVPSVTKMDPNWQLVKEVSNRFSASCAMNGHPLQTYQRWLLTVVRGGVFEEKIGVHYPADTGHQGVDNAFARIWTWLDKHKDEWAGNLQMWRDTKEEYMKENWQQRRPKRKPIPKRQPRKGTSRQELKRKGGR